MAREEGAEIHTSAPVKRVLLDGRRACGLELESGEKIHCDHVVLNADFGHAMSTLFDEKDLRRYKPASLRKRKFSCSTFMMYLGLDRTYETEHHMIVFARNYRKNIEAITQWARPIWKTYRCISATRRRTTQWRACRSLCAIHPSAGGEQHQRVSTGRSTSTPTARGCCNFFASALRMADVSPHIQQELIITPEDWEKKQSVFLGATFNMAHSWDQMMYLRPHNEFEEFENCYLVGGGTHPGSGLPTIFESARISANLICEKNEIPFPVAKPLELALA